jgi:anti-anti-sigma factor
MRVELAERVRIRDAPLSAPAACLLGNRGVQSPALGGSRMPREKGDLLTIEDTPTGCRLVGEVDATNADRLKSYIGERIEADSDFIIDCSGLRFMDSSGVHAILEVARRMGGGALVFRGCAPSLRRLFEVIGVEDMAPVVIE